MASTAGSRSTCGVARGPVWRWTGDLDGFVRRHQRQLALRVRRTLIANGELSPRHDQVEEVLQELYCRLLAEGGRRLERCRAQSEEQLAAYVARIAERTALDWLRSDRAARRRSPAIGLRLELDPADPSGSPEALALLAEARLLLLARCEAMVTGRNRRRDGRILRLLLDGWSSREIAQASGGRMPASVVDGLVYRIRRRLAARGMTMPARHRAPAAPAMPPAGGISSAR